MSNVGHCSCLLTSIHCFSEIQRHMLMLMLLASRLPLPVEPASTEALPELVLLADHLKDSPVTARDIRVWTEKDPTLSRVLQFLLQGWPSKCSPYLDAFSAK